MVNWSAGAHYVINALVQAQPPNQPVLEQLPPPKRAAVVLAIFAIVLTGLTLVLGIMIGAHWVRRMARQRPRGLHPTTSAKSASQRPLTPIADSLGDARTDATLKIDAGTKETKLDQKHP
jgi:hypothetical protein